MLDSIISSSSFFWISKCRLYKNWIATENACYWISKCRLYNNRIATGNDCKHKDITATDYWRLLISDEKS